MSVIEYLLDGLEAELELERELGVRSLEVDRALLGPSLAPRPIPTPTHLPTPTPTPPSPSTPTSKRFDFVFIHDRPLSEPAIAMMAKIIEAMHVTPDTAPIVVAPPIPQSKIYVFLGRAALNRYMPGVRAQEGQWFKSPKGKEIMLVKSPEEILRFETVSPAVVAIKQAMWRALKVVMQRSCQLRQGME